MSTRDIFERELAGEVISLRDPEYPKIADLITQAQRVIAEMNERRPFDFETLVRRFDEEMGQAIGDPAIHRLQFQAMIARLFASSRTR